MPYIENRIVHDADSHTMELPNWLDDYANKKVQVAFRERFKGNKGLAQTYFENIDETHQSKLYKEKKAEELMIRKIMTLLVLLTGKIDQKLWTYWVLIVS